ncbi:MAG: polysaccharide deacetylase family protein, partial [Clostridiaceae bacterium]|nr:polysaccharide deacetylase family protein [Clostridiaceae bacterium]
MTITTDLFPGGKTKALTLSYDDAVTQDIKLVEIFNRYGIKCTFNLNAGLLKSGQDWTLKGVNISKLKVEELVALYKGHEVAIHSYTHPHLELLPKDQIIAEIYEDRKALEEWFQYPVRGMAFPFGTYNHEVLEVLKDLRIEYSRTVNSHESFQLPENYLEWDPTCHHANSKVMDLAKEFLESDEKYKLSLFYLWGHSYEFDVDNNWQLIEEFCNLVAKNPSIWYATNIEIIDYLKGIKTLSFSNNGNSVYNPAGISIWIS